MFIHWGPVSLTGKEIGWSRGRETPIEEYDNLYKKFNPEDFNADEWVAIAKAAGMKYIVLTTRHHDGFCLWPSDSTDYDIAATPFKRDVVGELAAACRKQGLGFGAYYSTLDWWHPDYPTGSPAGKTDKPNPNMPRYIEYMKTQTAELVTKYGPLTCMWFDMPRKVTEADNEPTVAALHKLQPDLMINNRAYEAKGSIADFNTPEQRIGSFNNERPWETCMTICHQWAWKPNDPVKSLKECLLGLIGTIGGDGNFLFNVGPDAMGVVEPEQVKRLEEMGQWIARYDEAVYATRGGPFKPAGWGASTHKGNNIYLFISSWPDNGTLCLPLANCKILKAENLSGAGVKMTACETGYELRVQKADRDAIATVIKLSMDSPAASIEPVDMPSISGSLAFQKPAKTAEENFKNKAHHAFDDNPYSHWSTGKGKEQWLEVDLGQQHPIDSVAILLDSTGVDLCLQVQRNEEWDTVFSVENATDPIRKEFPQVIGQTFRILVSKGSVSVSEFQLFNTKAGK